MFNIKILGPIIVDKKVNLNDCINELFNMDIYPMWFIKNPKQLVFNGEIEMPADYIILTLKYTKKFLA